VILGYQIGIGAVFAGYIRDLAAVRKRREGGGVKEAKAEN